MPAFARIGMLVEASAVKEPETMRVAWKMSGNPVQQNADARVVATLHEMPEIIRCSKAARGREQAHRLVTPRPIEGIFRNRQQLDVGEAKLSYIRNQLIREFAIGQILAVTSRASMTRDVPRRC